MKNEKTAIYAITGCEHAPSLNVAQTWAAEKGVGAFCANYIDLCSFTAKGKSYILGYDGKQQSGDIYHVKDGGTGLELLKQTGLKQDYSVIQSFPVGAKPYTLAYDGSSGKMDFYGVAEDLTLVLLLSYQRTYGLTTQGFTTVIPYNYRGSILLLGYNSDNGTAVVYQISVPAEAPLAISEVWTKKWAPGWTRFAFFKLGGENFFLKSNPLHNDVNIDHMVDNPAEGSHPVGTHLPLALDLDAVAALDFNHSPYFASYRAVEGEMTISRIHGNCLGWTQVVELNAAPNCSHVIPFYLNEEAYLMVY